MEEESQLEAESQLEEESREVISLGHAIAKWRLSHRRNGPARQRMLGSVGSSYHQFITEQQETTELAASSSLPPAASRYEEEAHGLEVDSALKQLKIISHTFMLLGDCTEFASLMLDSALSDSATRVSPSGVVVGEASKEITNLVGIVGKHPSALTVQWVRQCVQEALSKDVPACEGVAHMLATFVQFHDDAGDDGASSSLSSSSPSSSSSSLSSSSCSSCSSSPESASIFAAPVFLGLSAALATLSFTESDPIIFGRGVPPLMAVIALAVRRNKGAMKRRDAAAAEWAAALAALHKAMSNFRPASILLSRITKDVI
jgi:hypothetical protein